METASLVGFVRIALVIIAIGYILRLLNKSNTSKKAQEQQQEMERMKEELRKSKEREGKVTIEKNPKTDDDFTDFEELD